MRTRKLKSYMKKQQFSKLLPFFIYSIRRDRFMGPFRRILDRSFFFNRMREINISNWNVYKRTCERKYFGSNITGARGKNNHVVSISESSRTGRLPLKLCKTKKL